VHGISVSETLNLFSNILNGYLHQNDKELS